WPARSQQARQGSGGVRGGGRAALTARVYYLYGSQAGPSDPKTEHLSGMARRSLGVRRIDLHRPGGWMWRWRQATRDRGRATACPSSTGSAPLFPQQLVLMVAPGPLELEQALLAVGDEFFEVVGGGGTGPLKSAVRAAVGL